MHSPIVRNTNKTVLWAILGHDPPTENKHTSIYSQIAISTHPAHKCAVKIHGCQKPTGDSSCLIYVSLHQGDNCQAFKLKSHSLKTEEVR